MHQGLHATSHKAIVHEDVLVDIEMGVSTLEIASAVPDDPMAEREVLGARRRTDWVGLHEAQSVERAFESSRREEAARDRGAPKVIQRHSAPLSVDGSRESRPRGAKNHQVGSLIFADRTASRTCTSSTRPSRYPPIRLRWLSSSGSPRTSASTKSFSGRRRRSSSFIRRHLPSSSVRHSLAPPRSRPRLRQRSDGDHATGLSSSKTTSLIRRTNFCATVRNSARVVPARASARRGDPVRRGV
jgi:hypothetical protein